VVLNKDAEKWMLGRTLSAPDPEGLPLEGAMICAGGILGRWGPKGPESSYFSALVTASNYHGMEDYTLPDRRRGP
jgi:hypothetical protein